MLDLAIVGGGPAGMSAALVAGRAMLNTVVINAEAARNNVTGASYAFLTRDGAHPSDILAASKQQLEKYDSVTYRLGTVATIEHHTAGFELTMEGGDHVLAKRLIIATGHRDELTRLELTSINEFYGKSVYPCVFCDGFEHRGQRLAPFGADDAALYAPMVTLWSADVTVFTNGRDLADASKR